MSEFIDHNQIEILIENNHGHIMRYSRDNDRFHMDIVRYFENKNYLFL